MRIGYVLKMYPRFSETFILNEVLELERQGLVVTGQEVARVVGVAVGKGIEWAG